VTKIPPPIERLGSRGRGRRWSADDDAFLIARHGRQSAEEIGAAMTPPRTADAVRLRSMALGITNRQAARTAWTPERDALLRAEWGRAPDGDLAERLATTILGMQRRASDLGLTRPRSHSTWTPARDALLFVLAGLLPSVEIARRLDPPCTESAVNNRMTTLGLTRVAAVGMRFARDRETLDRLRIALAMRVGVVTPHEASAATGLSREALRRLVFDEAARGVEAVAAMGRHACEEARA
jgi:hypothetical protein